MLARWVSFCKEWHGPFYSLSLIGIVHIAGFFDGWDLHPCVIFLSDTLERGTPDRSRRSLRGRILPGSGSFLGHAGILGTHLRLGFSRVA